MKVLSKAFHNLQARAQTIPNIGHGRLLSLFPNNNSLSSDHLTETWTLHRSMSKSRTDLLKGKGVTSGFHHSENLQNVCCGVGSKLTFWRRTYFYLIWAHPVYKMWIIQEPNMLELWNKLNFEEKKSKSIYHV